MSITHAFRTLFGLHERGTPHVTHRNLVLHEILKAEEPTAEVDSQRERFSARRYIAHLKAAQAGDTRGRAEWSRHILSMREDDARLFWGDFDALVEQGELVAVLTPDERAGVVQRVLENIDAYREMAIGRGPLELNPSAVNVLLDAGATQEERNAATEMLMEDMDDAEAEVWAEDEEDADIGEGDDDGEEEDDENQVEFEIEIGDDEPEEGR